MQSVRFFASRETQGKDAGLLKVHESNTGHVRTVGCAAPNERCQRDYETGRAMNVATGA